MKQEFSKALILCLLIVPRHLPAPSLLILLVNFRLIAQETRFSKVKVSLVKKRLFQVTDSLVLGCYKSQKYQMRKKKSRSLRGKK